MNQIAGGVKHLTLAGVCFVLSLLLTGGPPVSWAQQKGQEEKVAVEFAGALPEELRPAPGTPRRRLEAPLPDLTRGPVKEKLLSLNATVETIFNAWQNDALAQCFSGSKAFVCSDISLPERSNRESGYQLTEKISLFGQLSGFRLFLNTAYVASQFSKPRSELVRRNPDGSLAVESGDTNAELARTQGTSTISGLTDVGAGLNWSTGLTEKGWGIDLGVETNLPTGKTELTEGQLRALPSDEVVATQSIGGGFNIGPNVKLFLRTKTDKVYHVGSSLVYLGEFNPTKDIDSSTNSDNVPGGVKASIGLGMASDRPKGLRWGLRGEYDYTARSSLSNAFILLGNLDYDETWIFRANGVFTFVTVEDLAADEAFLSREDEYQEGTFVSSSVEWGYNVIPKRWSISALFDFKAGIIEKPETNDFAQGEFKYGGGLQTVVEYKGFRLTGLFKGFRLISEPGQSDDGGLQRGGGESITFDGLEVLLRLSYGFATGFFLF